MRISRDNTAYKAYRGNTVHGLRQAQSISWQTPFVENTRVHSSHHFREDPHSLEVTSRYLGTVPGDPLLNINQPFGRRPVEHSAGAPTSRLAGAASLTPFCRPLSFLYLRPDAFETLGYLTSTVDIHTCTHLHGAAHTSRNSNPSRGTTFNSTPFGTRPSSKQSR